MYSHTKSLQKEKIFSPGKRRNVSHKSFSLSNVEMYTWGSTDTDKSPPRKQNFALGIIMLSQCLDTGSGFHLESDLGSLIMHGHIHWTVYRI